MAMELVESMTKTPSCCFICGLTPYDGRKQKSAIDLNRDYDWGNNAYICEECGHLIATLLGYPDIDRIKRLLKTVSKQKDIIEELKKEKRETDKVLERIKDGSKAVREVKAA